MSRPNEDPKARAALRPRTMYLLNQSNQAVRTLLEQELRAIGLTGIQYTVLAIVDSRDGISSAELSRRFFVTPQTMNEIVTGLERRGLLVREQSAQSKRILTATLNEKGRRMLADCDAIADRIEEIVFDNLNDKDFQELRRILRLLLTSVRTGPRAVPSVTG